MGAPYHPVVQAQIDKVHYRITVDLVLEQLLRTLAPRQLEPLLNVDEHVKE